MSQTTTTRAWARVYPAVPPAIARNLRAGVWYAVVKDDLPDRVTLVLGETHVPVPRRILEIRPQRPTFFSVVHRIGYDETAHRKSVTKLGRFYAVCPECRKRFALYGKPERVTCPQCKHQGDVAWWEIA